MAAHENHHNEGEPRSKTAFRSSFWFVVILVGLFIAALNFINVEGHDSKGEDKDVHVNKEATSNETLRSESGLGKPLTDSSQHANPNTSNLPDSQTGRTAPEGMHQ